MTEKKSLKIPMR